MGEASSGLYKKSAVGWDGWFSILQVKWIVLDVCLSILFGGWLYLLPIFGARVFGKCAVQKLILLTFFYVKSIFVDKTNVFYLGSTSNPATLTNEGAWLFPTLQCEYPGGDWQAKAHHMVGLSTSVHVMTSQVEASFHLRPSHRSFTIPSPSTSFSVIEIGDFGHIATSLCILSLFVDHFCIGTSGRSWLPCLQYWLFSAILTVKSPKVSSTFSMMMGGLGNLTSPGGRCCLKVFLFVFPPKKCF